MCPSGATDLPADLFQWASITLYKTAEQSGYHHSSSYWNVICSGHDITGKLLI